MLDAPKQTRRVRSAPKKFSKTKPDEVGTGVRKEKPAEEKPSEEKREEIVSLDAPAEWVDEPQMVDQILKEGMWKHDKVEAVVLDFNKSDDVEKYNSITTISSNRNGNVFVTSEDKQFCEKTSNWKVLLQLQYVKYKKIIKKKS